MDQRISFITLAVADLERTRRFYVDGLGWSAEVLVPDEVLMIKVGEHVMLSFWVETGFEDEVGPIRRGDGVAPITLSHNVRTEAEVDEILALADRILVMNQGRIVGEIAGDKADERQLGLMMTGGTEPQAASS